MFPRLSLGPDPRPNNTSFGRTSRTHSHLSLSAADHGLALGEDDLPRLLSLTPSILLISLRFACVMGLFIIGISIELIQHKYVVLVLVSTCFVRFLP